MTIFTYFPRLKRKNQYTCSKYYISKIENANTKKPLNRILILSGGFTFVYGTRILHEA